MCKIDNSQRNWLTLAIIILDTILILGLKFSEDWKFLAIITSIILNIISIYLLWIFSNNNQNNSNTPNILIHEGRRLDDKLFLEKGLSCPSGYKIRNIDYPKDDIIKPGKYHYHVVCISEISKEGSIQIIPKPIITTPSIKIPMGTKLDNALFIKEGVGCSSGKLEISWSNVDIKKIGDYKYTATAIDQIAQFPQSGTITVEERPPINLKVPSFSILGDNELSKELFYKKGGSCSQGCEITLDYSNVKINQHGTYDYYVTASDGFSSVTKKGEITVIIINEKFNKATNLYSESIKLKDEKKYNHAARHARKALNIYQQIPSPDGESSSFYLMSELAEYLDCSYDSLLFLIIGNNIKSLDKYKECLEEKISKSGLTNENIEREIQYAKGQYDKDKGESLIESFFSKIDTKSVK